MNSNPHRLNPILQSCRSIHNALSTHNPYAGIFKAQFDTSAPLRHIGASASTNVANQLVRYCRVLKRIWRADLYSLAVLGDFWVAFVVMTKNDRKSERQLAAAGLPDYVGHSVLERL